MRFPDEELQPKKPPRASVGWFNSKAGAPTDPEVLFLALLTASNGATAGELDKWSAGIWRVHDAYMSKGVAALGLPANWASTNTLDLFEPIKLGYTGTEWSADRLGRIGAAMQLWEGCAQRAGLDAGRLKSHKQNTAAKKRWRSLDVLFGVARLLSSHGRDIRKLLKVNESVEELPSTWDQFVSVRAEAEEAHAATEKVRREHGETKAELFLTKDALRKANERASEKRTAVRDAKEAEREKAKDSKSKALTKIKEGWKRKRSKEVEKAREKAAEESAETLARMKARLAAAQKRARDKATGAKLASGRLKRAQMAEGKLQAALEAIDELTAAAEGAEAEGEDTESEDEGSGQTGVRKRARKEIGERRDRRGRFQASSWRTRVLVWAQLARRVAPSQIAANISDTLSVHAPDANEPLPGERQVQKMRGELTIAGEAMAAMRMALARRIISFGFDESTKYGLGVLSANVQFEPHDAPGTVEDVVPRGVCLIAGGKAVEVSAAVEKKIFKHGRTLLRRWKERHEAKFGEGSWEREGGADPESLGLHRLTEHTTLMSDTCNAARAAKRLLAEMALTAAKEHMGRDVWEAMTEEEQRLKVATYLGDCTGHLRNIVINAMVVAGADYLTTELHDSLDEFSSFDRVSLQGIDWIRATYKVRLYLPIPSHPIPSHPIPSHPTPHCTVLRSFTVAASTQRERAASLWLG